MSNHSLSVSGGLGCGGGHGLGGNGRGDGFGGLGGDAGGSGGEAGTSLRANVGASLRGGDACSTM